MDKQAREAREQMKQLGRKEKMTNFWYYYRNHVIVGIIAAVLIIYTAVECANRINYDLNVSYYSATPISADGVTALTEELKKNTDDINFNGQTDVYIASCFADTNNMSEQTQAVMMKLQAELAAGEAMGYMMDQTYYDMLSKNYAECFEEFVEISSVPKVREMLRLGDEQKVYWATKKIYEAEKDKEDKIAAHKNALKAIEYINSLK